MTPLPRYFVSVIIWLNGGFGAAEAGVSVGVFGVR
jgi:hypothetical protein